MAHYPFCFVRGSAVWQTPDRRPLAVAMRIGYGSKGLYVVILVGESGLRFAVTRKG